MTKEKTNLIKTLKDENLRAETHKYTQNLINNHKNRSLTVPSNNNNIKKEIENKILNEHKTEIKETNNNNMDNKNNISNGEENNKIKKKKKVKKKMKIKKSDKVENAENGQKYKLLTYQTLNQIINEKKEKENKIEDKKTENKSIVDKNIKKEKKEKNRDENKIKSNNDKESEKSNNTRRDLLNSLNNLQYNFDNLMEIGVHGNKILNNKKK
jgi:hypothetical protein